MFFDVLLSHFEEKDFRQIKRFHKNYCLLCKYCILVNYVINPYAYNHFKCDILEIHLFKLISIMKTLVRFMSRLVKRYDDWMKNNPFMSRHTFHARLILCILTWKINPKMLQEGRDGHKDEIWQLEGRINSVTYHG